MLMKENRDLEKELLELKKNSYQLNAIKKSETRAKTEKQKLKEELNQTALDFGNKENELLKRYNELQEENKRLLSKIEGFNAKMKEFQEKCNFKEREAIESEENIRNLELKLEEVKFLENTLFLYIYLYSLKLDMRRFLQKRKVFYKIIKLSSL